MKRPYWLSKFSRKFSRWWRYTKHLWTAPPWNEYSELFRLLQLQLDIMAREFDRTDYTTSSKQDANRMRLCSKLLGFYLDDHYRDRYYEAGMNPDSFDLEEVVGEPYCKRVVFTNKWRPGYSAEGWDKTMRKDEKCLHLALRILEQDSAGWWQ